MNLGELKTLTRTYIDEDATVTDKFWSDAEVTTAVNIGVRRTHNRIKNVSRWHFTTRLTFTTTAGVEYYNLPANLKDLKMVSFENANAKEMFLGRDPGPNMFAHQSTGVPTPATTGQSSIAPQSYWMVGPTMRILPVPQQAWTIRLYYEARISALQDDSSVPTFDEDYHDMAAKWAALELMPKNQDEMKSVATLLSDRDEDLVQDVLHRLPAPYTKTQTYLQGW